MRKIYALLLLFIFLIGCGGNTIGDIDETNTGVTDTGTDTTVEETLDVESVDDDLSLDDTEDDWGDII
jgi:hypothetical protein